MTNKYIQQFMSVPGLRIECPSCGEGFPVKRARLFNMYDSYPPAIQKKIRARMEEALVFQEEIKARKIQLAKDKKKKAERISVSTHATNFGQIAEQIIPAFTTFPYEQRECRVLFKPIDYIVFSGLAQTGKVDAIKFVDVKTGGARLSYGQQQIRDLVEEGSIKHRVIK